MPRSSVFLLCMDVVTMTTLKFSVIKVGNFIKRELIDLVRP